MSNFICEKCGTPILEGEDGHYITGCEHYPLNGKPKTFDPKATYYGAGGIETIDVIHAKLSPEQFIGFCMGNAIKYLCRANFKGTPRRDLEKAAIYIQKLLEEDREDK